MKTRTKIGIIIMMASMLICVVLPTNVVAEAGMNSYTNEVNNYSIEYPESWEKQESSYVVFRGPMKNGFYINVNIVLEELPSSIGLEEYASTSEKQMEAAFQNYHKEKEYSSTINDEPCIIREYTCTFQGIDMKQKQVYLIDDNKAYVITCSSTPSTYDEDNENYFIPTVQSFKFTEESGEKDKGVSWIWLIVPIVIIIIIAVLLARKKSKEHLDQNSQDPRYEQAPRDTYGQQPQRDEYYDDGHRRRVPSRRRDEYHWDRQREDRYDE